MMMMINDKVGRWTFFETHRRSI